MPTVLLTGSAGLVGRVARPRLEAAGWTVRPFDRATGGDLRDADAVDESVEGCEVIVHAGAIAHDRVGSPPDIMATNVLGTWHVLLAAESHRVGRVIYISSAQVFGFAEGEGTPAYRPVDDRHPLRAARPYGLSKRLAEEMCEAWTARTGIATIVLRPVAVLSDEHLTRITAADVDLGAYVHVDDMADAIVRSVTAELDGHVRLTVCGPGHFETSATERALGWRAQRGWPST